MSTTDLFAADFPHGTAEGYEAGCRGAGSCAGAEWGLTCARAHQLMRAAFGIQPGAIPDDRWATRDQLEQLIAEHPGENPFAGVFSVGDSMTSGVGGDGVTFPAVAAAQLGIPVVNAGVSGLRPTEVGIVQGGIQPSFDVAGGAIPTSGSVNLTLLSPAERYREGIGRAWVGSLGPVPGVLAKNTTDVWTFTRVTTGPLTETLSGVQFVSEAGSTHRNWIQTIWSGRNFINLDNILRETAAMVAYHHRPMVGARTVQPLHRPARHLGPHERHHDRQRPR